LFYDIVKTLSRAKIAFETALQIAGHIESKGVTMHKIRFLIGAAVAAAFGAVCTTPARADRVTECTAIDICYCVEADFKSAIDANVAKIRTLLAEQRSAGRAIGYMSIPLSTAGGSYFGVNAEVAAKTKARVEQRFGEKAVYLLNPGNADFSLPAKANGADYMLQWTRVLEGPGLGEDFNFFYFTGPTDFATALGLTGEADMDKIDSIFDQRLASDEGLRKAVEQGKVTKGNFRNYYGLRASIVFSYGSHDEWNIARILNERRRGATAYGLANQISIFYDGRPVVPAANEQAVASGDVGRCIN
jgi:hypothetical protein